jgi:L-fuconolactonase
LLELAAKHEQLIGVVGWLDPFADSFADEYGLLRNNPYFIGIRLDRSVFERCKEGVPDRLIDHLHLLEEDGFPVDLLITPEYMPIVLKWFISVPNLKAVINHLGSPPIQDGSLEPWNSYMHMLSQYPNVYCKWSGMITPAGGMNPHLIIPYIRITADLFGPGRIMFGGDWPVALMAGRFEEVIELFEHLLPDEWRDNEFNQVRFSNALKFYFGTEAKEG